MGKILQLLLIILLNLFIFFNSVYAQNCSVNAGINASVCTNQVMTLNGNKNGLFASGNLSTWTQVSGPSVTIVNASSSTASPSAHTSTVIGFTSGNVYIFRITGYCADGSTASQTVNYSVNGISLANAGTDQTVCAGTGSFAALAPSLSNERGTWSGQGAQVPTITSANSPTSTFTASSSNAGTRNITWTIANTVTGCSSSAIVRITNNSGSTPVNAGVDKILNNCYSITQSTVMAASYGGNGTNGQIGTWIVVSGPNSPVFSSIAANNATVTGLVQGTYLLRWFVSGPCVNGTDDITITVPAPTQSLTSIGITSTNTYCDGRTSVVLSRTSPGYSGEVASWTKISGTGGTIVNPSSPTVSITGLTGNSTYNYRYTITNTVTGCVTSVTSVVNYSNTAPTINTGITSTVLGCGITGIPLGFTVNGTNVDNTWKIISGPVTTSSAVLAGSPLSLTSLSIPGTYVVRIQSVAIATGTCPAAVEDIEVTTSVTPTVSNAGTNPAVACNVYTAALSGNAPSSGTGTWTQVGGPGFANIISPNSPNATVAGMINGAYTFRWLISGGPGCGSSQSDVRVTVASTAPGIASAGSDQDVCASTPIIIQGNTPALNETGSWTVTPTISAANFNPGITSPYASVIGLTSGTIYTFKWNISNNCGISFGQANYSVSTIAGPAQAYAGPDICQIGAFTTAFMNANSPSPAGATGTWNQVSGPTIGNFSDISSPTATVTGLTFGTYKFEWRLDRGGCNPTRDTVGVTIALASVAGANAGADLLLCGNQAMLNGNNVTTVTGTWSQVSGAGGTSIAGINLYNTSVSGLSSGTYVFRWTLSNGVCPSTNDDVTINITNPPTLPNAGSDYTVCGGTTTTLSGNSLSQGSGYWTLEGSAPSVPSISPITSPTPIVTGLFAGTYMFRWTVSNGPFCTSYTDDIVVNVSPAPFAGVDRAFCNTSSLALNGNSGTTGTWSQESGPASSSMVTVSGNSVNVTGLTTGVYTFRYSSNALFTCPALFDDVVYTFSGFGTTPDAGADQEFCNQTVTTLSGNNPSSGTGSWSIVSGYGGTILGASLANATLSGMSPGVASSTLSGIYIVQWNIANEGCGTFADIVRITTHRLPTVASAGADLPNACSSTSTLSGNNPTYGSGIWTQVSGPTVTTLVSPIVNRSQIAGLTLGGYTFRWTVSNGTCSSSADDVNITVTGLPPITAIAGANQALCNQAVTTLAGNNPAPNSGFWSLVSGPNTPSFVSTTTGNTTLSGLSTGNYVLRWTTQFNSCNSISNLTVTNSALPTTASILGGNLSYCPYEVPVITGSRPNAGTGLWSYVSGSGSPVINAPGATITSINALTAGNAYTFRWSISNGVCPVSTANINFNILSNCPPIGPDFTITGFEDQVLIKTISGFTDPDGIIPTVSGSVLGSVYTSVQGFPLTINGFNSSTGAVTVRYKPGIDFNGTDSYAYSVCDQTTCASGIITFSVTGVNDPPVVKSMTVTGLVNTTLTGTLTSSLYSIVPGAVYDVDHPLVTINGMLVFTSTGILTTIVGSGRLTVSGIGAFTYVPNATFTGTYIYPVVACDVLTCTSGAITFSVTGFTATDLSLTFAGPASALAGSTITNTFTGLNNGPISASNTTISGILPAGLVNVSVSNGGNYSSVTGIVKWPSTTMGIGASVRYLISYTAPASGTIVGVSTILSSVTDNNITNNTSTGFTIIIPVADVSTSITGAATANAGSIIVYTLSGTNNGPSTATNTTLTGILPSGLTGVSVSNLGSYNPSTGIVSWPSTTLGTGSMIRYTITFTGPSSGTLNSTVAGFSGVTDNVTTNNTATLSTSIVPVADVSTSITGAATANAGSIIVYTLSGSNNGPSTATNTTLTGILPSGLTGVSVSNLGSYNPSTGIVSWASTTLGTGSMIRYTITFTGPSSGTLNSTVAGFSGVTDNVTPNNTATLSTSIVPVADVSTSITGAATANAGSIIVYTLSGTNNGPSTATNTTLTGILPSGLTGVSVSNLGSYNPSTGIVSWASTTLGTGSTIRYTVTFTGPTSGTLNSTVTGFSGVTDNVIPNNTATLSTAINSVSDLAIDITGPALVNASDIVIYTVMGTNNGPSTATNTTLTGILPAGLAVTNVSDGGSYNTSSGTISWPVVITLNTGASVTYTITYTAPASGTITGIVSITSAISDFNTANNKASVITAVTPVAEVGVTLAAPSNMDAGDVLIVTFSGINNGPSQAQLTTITGLIPAGLTGVAISHNGVYNASTGKIRWPVTLLGINQSFTLFAFITVPGTLNVIESTLTGYAATFDPDLSNNIAVGSTNIHPVADLVATISGPSTSLAGSPVILTVTGINKGPSSATGVAMITTLPSGLTVTNVSNGGSYDSVTGIITWPVLTGLPVGLSNIYTITLTAPSMGTVSATVTGTITENDPNPVNNTDIVSNTIVITPIADIEVTISMPTVAPASTIIINTITVTNNGPSNATGLTVAGILPIGLPFTGSSDGGSYNVGTGKLTWPLTALGVGSTLIYTITFTGPATGSFVSSATGYSAILDLVPDNNTAAGITLINEVADVIVASATSSGTLHPGDYLVFTITGMNNGPSVSTLVGITTTLPSGLTNVSVSEGAYNTLTGVITWPVNTSLTVTSGVFYTLTVIAPISGFSITSTGTSSTFDPDQENNTNIISTVSIDPVADLGITIAGISPVFAGSTVIYTISGINYGPNSSATVSVSGITKTGLTGVSVSNGGNYNATTGAVSWPLASLTSGDLLTYAFSYIAPPSGSVDMTVNIQSSVFDPVLANNTSSVGSLITALADLSFTLTGPPIVSAGTPVIITVNGTNYGPSTSVGVAICVTLPSGLTGVVASDGGVYDITTGALCWPLIPSLPNRGTLTYTFSIISGIGESINIPLGSSSQTLDPNPFNNNSEMVISIAKSADLAILITGPSAIKAAHIINYTVTSYNNGSNNAADVLITVTLTSGLTDVAVSDGGTYNPVTGVINWPLIAMAVQDTVVYKINITAPYSGTIMGLGFISAPLTDPYLPNNADTIITTIIENEPPVATDDNFLMFQNETLVFDLIANDVDPDGTITGLNVSVLSLPESVFYNGNGTITVHPTVAGLPLTGTYQVCDNGFPVKCDTATFTIIVTGLTDGSAIVYDGFSPNGDGNNDVFFIENHGKKVGIKVYNRWGNLVYESDDYNNDWDGKATQGFVIGNRIPDGTYFCEINLNDGAKPTIKFITISR